VLPEPSLQSCSCLSDDELLHRLAALLKASRRVEAVLILHIGEVDARRLFAREAAPSMFAYCTGRLGLSEHEAYLRITVARASRQRPVLLAMLADGRLHLSGIAKLLPHLTDDNATTLLQRASGRSTRQVEELVAGIAPRPDAPALVRLLPQTAAPAGRPSIGPSSIASPAETVPAPPAVAPRPAPPPQPLSPDRYRIQFTASSAFCSKIERLRDLLRVSIPDGDIAVLIDRAVTELVGRLEARWFGLTSKPRARETAHVEESSRHVPTDVRRAVFARDEGQCRFIGTGGVRCPARRQLEYHHVEPYARGGATSVGNIQLMCGPHNAYLAERDFGAAHIQRFRKDRAGPDDGSSNEATRPPPRGPSRA
jgi:5-methylcytosine-specific restriction endonuclease McrA